VLAMGASGSALLLRQPHTHGIDLITRKQFLRTVRCECGVSDFAFIKCRQRKHEFMPWPNQDY